MGRNDHAFECLGPCPLCKGRGKLRTGFKRWRPCPKCKSRGQCRYEWRDRTVRIVPSEANRWLTGRKWPINSCPSCGSIYYEWLSFDVRPRDVYLRSENVPKSTLTVRSRP